jgi:hypothetical protein
MSLERFEVSPQVVTLIYGGTPDRQQITVETYPSGVSASINFTSADTQVATVSETGLIVAAGEGTTKIAVTVNGKTTNVNVTVEPFSKVNLSRADTWVAVDALGRKIGNCDMYGSAKERYVGIFYFLWLGAHGYDNHAGGTTDFGIFTPSSTDTRSPYDISQLLRENPSNPQYGPVNAFHHWGEPHFGYYVSNDEWVIEKHVQLLADAGVDVLILDNTNALIYLPQLLKLCEVMTRMRAQGRATPQIASIINASPAAVLYQLYNEFYAKGLYSDLWFYWKGKPLALCPNENLTNTCKNFFTLRHSWFSSRESWFGNGKDKWTWADYYPQGYGWHTSPAKAEQISVAAATHPTSNIGRSYSKGHQPATPKSGEGLFFAEQWKRALEVDPEFVFITGWNEWVAMRFTDGKANQMCGVPIRTGDTYFVDQYNEEYSRDIEPMRGGFGDNYYYQMVDNIRRYKGVSPTPVTTKKHTIAVDGDARDWEAVEISYYDDTGDIPSRNHFGWGRIGTLVNTSGRNDFVSARAAHDDAHVYFLAETANPVQLSEESPVQLFIGTEQEGEEWEGFQFRLDILPENKANLYVSKGGWNWDKVMDIPCCMAGNCIELSVPLQNLGISDTPIFDFKWADNMPQTGNIRDFMDHGDTAPNARFRYRYVFNMNNE